MPTKYKNRLQRIRDRYAARSDYEKSQTRARYALNSNAVIERSTARMQTDTTSRSNNRVRTASYTKKRIADDVQYRERNRVTAAQSKIRRLETDEAYHAAHVESAKEYKKKKLQNDEKYHAVHVKSAKEYKKKKLQSDEKYHAAHVESAKEYKTKRLQSDKKYHAAHVKSAKDYKKEKLQTNVNYRYQNLQSTKIRLKTNTAAREVSKRRALNRYRKARQDKRQKEYHKAVVHVTRQQETTDLPPHIRRQIRKQRVKKKLAGCLHQHALKSLTSQQKYWLRKSRLLAVARVRRTRRRLLKKMHSESGNSTLDIQLLFNRAEKQLQQSRLKVQSLHKNLAQRAADFLQYLPAEEQVTEDHLLTAFEGSRIHSSASETYFLEHSYHILPANSTIPVDEHGKAHLFDIVDQMSIILPATESPDMQKTVKWHCNPKICKITRQAIDGVTNLFKAISSLTPNHYCTFYHHLDDCSNPARTDQMGHTLHCMPDSQCSSLLHPARAVASHFPELRSYVRRLYEIRQLVRHIEAVKSAMSSGNFDLLKDAVVALTDLTAKLLPASKDDEQHNTNINRERYPVNE